MKKFATVAAAAALFAVPALAQAQAFVQVEGGIDNVSVAGDSKTGIVYSGTIGYDHALSGGMFIGLQASFGDSDTKTCVREEYYDYDVNVKACLEAGRDVSVLARLGTQVSEKGKLYVMAGYANARAELNVHSDALKDLGDYYLGTPIDGLGAHADLDGVRVGAGYEHAINDRFFLKAEYRYTNYASDFSRHQGVLALGTKF